MPKLPTKLQKKVIRKHYVSPKTFSKREAMRALDMGFDYNKFHTLFYRCMIEDA